MGFGETWEVIRKRRGSKNIYVYLELWECSRQVTDFRAGLSLNSEESTSLNKIPGREGEGEGEGSRKESSGSCTCEWHGASKRPL